MKRKKSNYEIAMIYDTETCNIIDKMNNAHAYPILFIENDVRGVNMREYDSSKDGVIHFYRTENEFLKRIDTYITWGKLTNKVPIVCGYNLMFDLQPLMEELDKKYDINASAQSSTNVYTVDLCSKTIAGKVLLRFWDTFHLEMRGLAAMGRTAGLPKATGDWDYNLIRTPQTVLTKEELFYARRDVEVIPAYFRYLLQSNEWMKQSDLGFTILTKTGIVRQMAKRQIGSLSIEKQDDKKITLDYAFIQLCNKCLPKSFDVYALRKACFYGGWTFTSARYASTVQKNVLSADVTSMHHTFINGRMIPDDFKLRPADKLTALCERIVNTTAEQIFDHYEKPFDCAIHARIEFENVRMRKGTCFEYWGLALEPLSKFRPTIDAPAQYGFNEAAMVQEEYVRSLHWYNQFEDGEFAFGKLYNAKRCIMHFNEIELWCFGQVYEWDSMRAVYGESSGSFVKPPDYVTLQSNLLYKRKDAAKRINATYREGVPYVGEISNTIPDGIAQMLRSGECSEQFFASYYQSTVKGMFNGIYGTMAQDIYKPEYTCLDGNLLVDINTRVTENNWEERQPNTCRVLYTYGMRIVAGSRMHMLLAMQLIWNTFGKKVRVLGGDTDSMKMSLDSDVTDEDIEMALESMEEISTHAINVCMERIRSNFPDLASDLKGVGGFELENKGHHYELHYEAWNKARISYDGKYHITCAGLRRPDGMYHIEHFMRDLELQGNAPKNIIQSCLGYNIFVSHNISHVLESHHPSAQDVYDNYVTDYRGETMHVVSHESPALYAAGRWLGDTSKYTNASNVAYMREHYGRDVDTRMRELVIDGKARIELF